MPQVGWRDPATGKERTFADWLAEAEAYGSAMEYPYEVLEGIRQQLDKSDRPDGITVTQLNGCARKVHIEQLLDFYTDPTDNYAAFRGTLAHSLVEKFKPEDAIIEMRYYRRYKGITISGQLDSWRIPGHPKLTQAWHQWVVQMEAWEGGGSEGEAPAQPVLPEGARFRVTDWKTKHELPTFTYLMKGYQQQGNMYRWLLRIPQDLFDMEFVFISMKGVKTQVLYNGGSYRNGRAKPEQVWTERQVAEFLDDRLLTLAASKAVNKPLPYEMVPADDLWNCNYCPARDLCYRMAADEAAVAFAAGKRVDRIPPRDRMVETGKKK